MAGDNSNVRREAAIANVREAWKVLASVVPEDPGEMVDVAHVRVVDGEGEKVDAALVVVRKGRVSRVTTQGMGETFEAACDMLAQILLLRASLLRAARGTSAPPEGSSTP